MSIQVAARIRPLLDQEKFNNEKIIWQCDYEKNTLVLQNYFDRHKSKNKRGKKFIFSEVFGTSHKNKDIFNKLVKDLVKNSAKGEHCSFFVYGQTGSGKTHTITGSEEEEGVVQLTMRFISNLKARSKCMKIHISSFEVYKEQIYDLLNDNGYREPLKINEKAPFGNFEIGNLSEHRVEFLEEMVDVLRKADEQRHFAETYLDHLSSRSHMGFRISIENDEGRNGSMTFIDLAGCEKIRAYADSGRDNFGHDCSPARAVKKERLIEGQFINKSVFFLDQVLKKLSSRKVGHVPFRSSTITKILKCSLTGGKKSRAMVCINPSERSVDNSLSSMNFAIKTSSISKNKLKTYRRRSVTPSKQTIKIKKLERFIKELKEDNTLLKSEVEFLRNLVKEKDALIEMNTTKNSSQNEKNCNETQSEESEIDCCVKKAEEVEELIAEKNLNRNLTDDFKIFSEKLSMRNFKKNEQEDEILIVGNLHSSCKKKSDQKAKGFDECLESLETLNETEDVEFTNSGLEKGEEFSNEEDSIVNDVSDTQLLRTKSEKENIKKEDPQPRVKSEKDCTEKVPKLDHFPARNIPKLPLESVEPEHRVKNFQKIPLIPCNSSVGSIKRSRDNRSRASLEASNYPSFKEGTKCKYKIIEYKRESSRERLSARIDSLPPPEEETFTIKLRRIDIETNEARGKTAQFNNCMIDLAGFTGFNSNEYKEETQNMHAMTERNDEPEIGFYPCMGLMSDRNHNRFKKFESPSFQQKVVQPSNRIMTRKFTAEEDKENRIVNIKKEKDLVPSRSIKSSIKKSDQRRRGKSGNKRRGSHKNKNDKSNRKKFIEKRRGMAAKFSKISSQLKCMMKKRSLDSDNILRNNIEKKRRFY